MDKKQLEKASRLKNKLDVTNKTIDYMKYVKRTPIFNSSPRLTVVTDSLTSSNITFCSKYSKMIADYILVLMEDEKQALETQIKNI